MVSKTRADDYKIQIQRFRDQPEIFYLELTWFSKSPSPASPTLPCASPSHVCSTYTYLSTQRRSRHVTVTRCSNVDGEISIINWNHSQVEDPDQVSRPQHADQARPRSPQPRSRPTEHCPRQHGALVVSVGRMQQWSYQLHPATCVLPTRIRARRGGVDT